MTTTKGLLSSPVIFLICSGLIQNESKEREKTSSFLNVLLEMRPFSVFRTVTIFTFFLKRHSLPLKQSGVCLFCQ